MKRTTVVFCTALLLTGGCATSKPNVASRALARATLAEIVAYEKAVRDLREVLRSEFEVHLLRTTKNVGEQQAVVVDSARTQLAFDAAERVRQKGFDAADLRAFVVAYGSAGRSAAGKLDEQLKDLRTASVIEPALSDTAEKNLKKVRQQLELLQQLPKAADEIQAYRNLLDAARKALKEKAQ